MKATWIWYPGDFEVWLGNKFNNRRTERGAMFPPFWKQDSHWPTVVFTKSVNLPAAEAVDVAAEGQCSLSVDGRFLPCGSTIAKGKHLLSVKVWNQATPPALFIDGPTIKTDGSWLVTYEDKIWIDENGVAHGSGVYVPVGCWRFNSLDAPPSAYHLQRREMLPVGSERIGNGALYDFGRETFGYLKLKTVAAPVHIYYGESREEALDKAHCETLDCLNNAASPLSSKAFRFVYVETTDKEHDFTVAMDYEFAPFNAERSGSFQCSDDELNSIWNVSAYTLDLTTREFFCDGIKRDRWTWSGDAIQSYLMNYYLRFDADCVKRTIRQLRGKDPVTAHVNTIMDYTFYWFKSVLDYYDYSGDVDFVREMWPKMVTLMDYALQRTNANGMAEGQPDDWIFVDWVDFPMHKRGALAFEQILFWKALKTMELCGLLLQHHAEATHYRHLAEQLKAGTMDLFYSHDQHAFLHAIEDGSLNEQVTKFPNMFAILYDFVAEEEKKHIADRVLLNADIEAITTPYMRFYELEALCQMGRHCDVLREIKAYWGGMLREGATTFWEKYNPNEHGTEHLAMYGRPYGKSLCHAWGASPLYVIGRYFLGVRPTKPGYEAYEVRPVLGGLQWMEGSVPTPRGMVRVRMTQEEVIVCSDFTGGTLVVADKEYPIIANRNNRFKL